jgi:hypothetical protein
MSRFITDPTTLLLSSDNCEIEKLVRGSKRKFFLYRALVALHKNTPRRILCKLCLDGHPSVLCSVASNPNLLVGCIRELSHHPDEAVRSGAARNPKIPARDLARLRKDESAQVRSSANQNKKS